MYIKGDHNGLIKTGDPSTQLTVHGNFNGKFEPNNGPGSLATITVHGFTDIKTIQEIFKNKHYLPILV